MDLTLSKIKSGFELSLALARAGFKERNEGSYLGIFWYFLNPLLLFLLLLLVFSDRLGNDILHYPLYLLLGIIMFNLFQKTTTESTKAIYENRWIIKSINFSRESLISSIVLKNLFSHFFDILLFIVILLFFKQPALGIVFYPILIIFFGLFIFGASLMLASCAVYFTDLDNAWAFVSLLIWLGTPIFYAVEGQNRLFFVNLFNPMYYFITIARELIIYSKIPEYWVMGGAVGYSIIFLTVGLKIFSTLKLKFAELV